MLCHCNVTPCRQPQWSQQGNRRLNDGLITGSALLNSISVPAFMPNSSLCYSYHCSNVILISKLIINNVINLSVSIRLSPVTCLVVAKSLTVDF